MKYCLTIGRWFFAIAMAGFGLQQLLRQDFVRLVPKPPFWASASPILSVVSGALLVIATVATLLKWKRVPAAIFLGGFFLVVLLLYIPGVIANPGASYVWTNPCKTLALIGGTLLLFTLAKRADAAQPLALTSSVQRTTQLSAFFFGVFFVVGGIQHFVYVDFVMQLVPAWIPAPHFWACVTGAALIAGALGVNFKPLATWAATLSGVMIFLWILLLHIPRALAVPHDPGETSAVFEALALSGTAFLIAGSRAEKLSSPASTGAC